MSGSHTEEIAGGTALPVVTDPYSKLEDEIAGDTADEIAENLCRSVQLSHRLRLPLLHEVTDVNRLFRGLSLGDSARSALRKVERALIAKSPARQVAK